MNTLLRHRKDGRASPAEGQATTSRGTLRPRWAVTAGTLIALLGALTQYVFLPALDRYAKIEEANAAQRYSNEQHQVDERARHEFETPKLLWKLGELVRVELFKSDGCIRVSRFSGGAPSGMWLPDLSLAHREPAPASPERQPVVSQGALRGGALPWESVALAQPQGTCLNPHPGQFRQSNGQRKGCWLQVYRTWDDGCKQYQWFDSCYGVWEKNKDGTDKVTWEVCNH